MTQTPRSTPLRTAADVLAVLLLCATAFVAWRRLFYGDCQYVVWSDRDLARSAVAFTELPTLGPELSTGSGARIPGGFFHTLLWLAGRWSPSPHTAWMLQVGLDTLAAALIALSARARIGWVGASVAASFYLVAGPNVLQQQPLWNPAWLSLFVVVATLAWIRAQSDRDGRSVVVWAVALALGAQMHITALLLGAVMAPTLIWLPLRHRVRTWVVAGGGVLLVYGPYLVHEAVTGWVNTRAILSGGGTHGWIGLPYTLSVLTALRALTSERPMDLIAGIGLWVQVVAVLAPIGVLLGGWLLWRGPASATRTLAGRLAIVAVITLAVVTSSDEYDFVSSNNARYLLVLLPLVTWCAGLAAQHLVDHRRGGPILAFLWSAALVGSMGIRLYAFDTFSVVATGTRGCADTTAWLDVGAQTLGTSRAVLAGNTVVMAQDDHGGWKREHAMPVDALLRPYGDPFPGSGTPPCAAILPNRGAFRIVGTGVSQAALQHALGPQTVVASVDDTTALPGDVLLVRYTPAGMRCPSNMTQRYLLTPAEQVTRTYEHTLGTGVAVRLAGPDDATQWVLKIDAAAGRFDPPWDVLLLLAAERRGAETRWTLHSNQLRGHAWNTGFFRDAIVHAPTLIARSGDGVELGRLVLADGQVGGDSVLTPLVSSVTWPPGAHVSLLLGVEPSAVGNAGLKRGEISTAEFELPGVAP